MPPAKMHELEKQALEDEFLADALEGFTYVIEPAEKLSVLQQRLADRILVQEANKRAFSISAQRLSVAAASGLMFVLAAILFWMHGYKTPEVTKQVQVNLAVQPQLNPTEGIKEAGTIAKTLVSPIIALVERTSRSEPVAGWDEYNGYIQKNIPNHKSLNNLVISFKISDKGHPVELKLVEGTPGVYSEEVIRAIKNGPLWKALDSEEVKVRVNFKE